MDRNRVNGSRTDFNFDFAEAAIVVEHFLLTNALQPKASRFEDA